MARCTNAYLSEGYKLTAPESGNTIAVLIDGGFARWAAGAWRPKSQRAKTKGLKSFKAAKRAARLRQETS